jgi:glycosyltransferase involved in cell wall biosynthesis
VSYVGIAAALEAHGFEPHVVATHGEVALEFGVAGVPVTHAPADARESTALRRAIKQIGASAVLVDRVHDLRVATWAVAASRVPLIYRYNHFGARMPADPMVRLAYSTRLREQVFLSNSARERVLGALPFMRAVPATTIHEGIDSTEFRPSHRAASRFRRNHGLGATPFLLAVGALSREKKYEVLFDALRHLGPRAPQLVILGEGPDERKLRERAEEHRLDVRFLGRVKRDELVGAYNACQALVHAGSVETFGLAVLEAMSCGRPVIASAGGALPEVVGTDGTCGALAAIDSAWDIAAVIARVLADHDGAERMGMRARDRARHHFSLAAMQRAYAQLVARHTGYRITPQA